MTISFECPKRCGVLHTKCSGHRQRAGHEGEPCNAQPMRGTEPPRCRRHLGGGLTAKQQAADYDLQRRAARLADLAGPVRAVDVEDVLGEHLRLAGEALRWKEVLAGLVSSLSDVGYRSRSGEQIRAEVKVYGEALDRVDRVLTNIGKLRIEERLAAVEEAREARMRAVLVAALDALGLSLRKPEVAEAVRAAIVATEPRRLPGGAR